MFEPDVEKLICIPGYVRKEYFRIVHIKVCQMRIAMGWRQCLCDILSQKHVFERPLSYRGHFDNLRNSTSVWEGLGPVTWTTQKRDMKIYTKTGDKGTSSLFTGERRVKSDKFFDALGTTDELSSHIALAREFANEAGHSYVERLRRIQCILQDVASIVATPKSSAREAHLKRVEFSLRYCEELEEWIDEYSAELPPLKNFILPGGGKASASLHIARTVCRRAERAVAPLVSDGEINKEALVYLNRLSDLLFTMARYAAQFDKQKETIYIREEPTPKKSK